MKIIGIDPGFAIVGWGILVYNNSKFMIVDYGAILTKSEMSFSQRLFEIYLKLSEILKIYSPTNMAIETLFFNSNRKTAINVAQARGVILLTAQKHGIKLFEYTPIQVKQSITGYGRATKNQVIDMTTRILNLHKKPSLDDTADALAVAVAHAHFSSSKLFNLK